MHLHKALSVVSAALAATTVAAPTEGSAFRRNFGGVQITGCDLSQAQLPQINGMPARMLLSISWLLFKTDEFINTGTTKLPNPSPGLKLSRVLLGRGTQNYT
jgi:hypothetical protein